MAGNDTVFTGSIPALYDRYLGPLLFEPFARHIAGKVADLEPARVLETAAGTGIVTTALAERLPASATLIATDLNQAMIDHGDRVGLVERPLLAAAHHGELAVLSTSLAARNRRIDEVDADLLAVRVELAGDVGRGGGVVVEDRALAHAFRARDFQRAAHPVGRQEGEGSLVLQLLVGRSIGHRIGRAIERLPIGLSSFPMR